MLSQAIDSYIAIRRAAGFQLKVQEGLLRNFARYATDRSQAHVRRQTAIEWAALAPSPYSAGTSPRHGAPVCVPHARRGSKA